MNYSLLKILRKKIIALSVVALFFVGFLPVVHATGGVSVILQHVPNAVDQQQEFYIDVMVDTDGMSINGIQGQVSFSNTLSFVRAETGSSNITLWVDQPHLLGNSIAFSGIIPGGFDGQINPFDTDHKNPGEIVRLVFAGKAAGQGVITVSNVSVADNDGNGTLQSVADTTKNIAISDKISPSIYTLADTIAPTLSASVVSEKNLFDGKYTLLFTATDKESGVARVEVKEENSDWVVAESPYLLHNQSKKGIISVRAFDVAGNATTVTLTLPETPLSFAFAATIIILVLVLLSTLYVVYKKIKDHKKNTPLS